MSETAVIDLHARRPTDLPALFALAHALGQRGLSVLLSATPELLSAAPGAVELSGPELCGRGRPAELRRGPQPAALRVLVEDPYAPLSAGQAATGAQALAVLWEGAGPAARELGALPETLARAELVLVPGAEHAAALRGRIAGRAQAVGLPALDAWGPPARAAARARLRLPPQARVWLYAPSTAAGSPALWFPDEELEALGEADAVVLALAGAAWPAPWRERHRALAARWPAVVLLEERDPARLLALADAVAADASSLLFAAAALGLPCAELVQGAAADPGASRGAGEPPQANGARALHELLARGAGTPAPLRLEAPGRAAERAAEQLAALLQRPAAAVPQARTGESAGFAEQDARRLPDWLEPIEAQLAFGDLAGARAALERRAQRDPAPAVQRQLARVQRLAGELGGAERSAERAAAAARSELAAALCEQARIEVELGRFERARERFEEAAQSDAQLADCSVGLGSLALHAADGSAAEAHFHRALLLEKSARAWSGLGLALCAQGRSRDALRPLASALDLDPECQAALYGLVQAALQTGELELAADRLQHYVELHPGNLGFAFSLAGIALQRGELERAAQALERIELFDPNYPGVAELRQKLGAH